MAKNSAMLPRIQKWSSQDANTRDERHFIGSVGVQDILIPVSTPEWFKWTTNSLRPKMCDDALTVFREGYAYKQSISFIHQSGALFEGWGAVNYGRRRMTPGELSTLFLSDRRA